MISHCRGCTHELSEAQRLVLQGLHIATMKNREFIGSKGHLCIILVNDDGKVVIW